MRRYLSLLFRLNLWKWLFISFAHSTMPVSNHLCLSSKRQYSSSYRAEGAKILEFGKNHTLFAGKIWLVNTWASHACIFGAQRDQEDHQITSAASFRPYDTIWKHLAVYINRIPPREPFGIWLLDKMEIFKRKRRGAANISRYISRYNMQHRTTMVSIYII